MKKTILFFGILFTMALTVQAQHSSARLVQLFYGKQVDRVVNEIYEITPDSTKQVVKANLDVRKAEVINTIASDYSTQFSEDEIDQLILFFSSPLSQKWEGLRGGLEAKNIKKIMEWGMALRENQTPSGN
jgi:hypothetical protein